MRLTGLSSLVATCVAMFVGSMLSGLCQPVPLRSSYWFHKKLLLTLLLQVLRLCFSLYQNLSCTPYLLWELVCSLALHLELFCQKAQRLLEQLKNKVVLCCACTRGAILPRQAPRSGTWIKTVISHSSLALQVESDGYLTACLGLS